MLQIIMGSGRAATRPRGPQRSGPGSGQAAPAPWSQTPSPHAPPPGSGTSLLSMSSPSSSRGRSRCAPCAYCRPPARSAASAWRPARCRRACRARGLGARASGTLRSGDAARTSRSGEAARGAGSPPGSPGFPPAASSFEGARVDGRLPQACPCASFSTASRVRTCNIISITII